MYRTSAAAFRNLTRRRQDGSHQLTPNPSASISRDQPHRLRIFIAAVAIFLIALGVRVLMRQDAQVEALKVQSGVAADYQKTAELIEQSGLHSFFKSNGPLADPNLLGHPPGYPILRYVIARLFGVGDSTETIQRFQITCDALAAVLVFFIAFELLSFTPAVISGLLVAFAPQFAWNSVVALPDTLAVVPILLAMLLLIHAVRRPRVAIFACVGVLLGVSCWLRANAMFLPVFVAAAAGVVLPTGRRFRYAATLFLAAVLVIGILTVRNWIAHEHFIPVSLGAGQTLLEGIAEYDKSKRFGIPETDMGIMKMEADEQNRPDYYSTLFAPDGVKRERARLARGFAIIARNPVWFASVMVRRAASMLRLERAKLVSPVPPYSNGVIGSLPVKGEELVRVGPGALATSIEQKAEKVQIIDPSGGEPLHVVTDNSKYDLQLRWKSVMLEPYHDYVLVLPARIEQGRVFVEVVGSNSQRVLNSSVLELTETKSGIQPTTRLMIPFTSYSDGAISIQIRNGAARTGQSVIDFEGMELYGAGANSLNWTRYPRLIVATIQQFFITAVMLPLAVLGSVFLVRARHRDALILLIVVPVYYLSVQSALHTEYRYVLAIHYFLFVFVAIGLHHVGIAMYGFARNTFRKA